MFPCASLYHGIKLRQLGRNCGSLNRARIRDLLYQAMLSDRSAETIDIIGQIPLGDNASVYQEEFKQGRRATLKKQLSTPSSSNHCPILARIKARERLAMRMRLRENFIRMYSQFLERSSAFDASYELSMFAERMFSAQKVWKRGFDSIRCLLNNSLPSSLQEVFACVQLSHSMRSSLDESTGVENAEASEAFLADLDR